MKRQIIKEDFKMEMPFEDDSSYNITVKIRGLRTTVILNDTDRSKASVYCNSNDLDKYNKYDGIDRAFKKAIATKLMKEVNK